MRGWGQEEKGLGRLGLARDRPGQLIWGQLQGGGGGGGPCVGRGRAEGGRVS